MKAGEIVWLPATELANLYRSGALSPVDAVNAHLARIETLDPRINSYITVTGELRDRVQRRRGSLREQAAHRALDGVPFALDIFATRGIRLLNGRNAVRTIVPVDTATAVGGLRLCCCQLASSTF